MTRITPKSWKMVIQKDLPHFLFSFEGMNTKKNSSKIEKNLQQSLGPYKV